MKRKTASKPKVAALYKEMSIVQLGSLSADDDHGEPTPATIDDVKAFVATWKANAPDTFMRERIASIVNIANAIRATKGATDEQKLFAERCIDRAREADHFVHQASLTGDGIDAAMSAAFALGDDWQSLQIVSSAIPVDVHVGTQMNTGRKIGGNIANEQRKEDRDAEARNAFFAWTKAHKGLLANKSLEQQVIRFNRSSGASRRTRDRIKTLQKTGRLTPA